MKSNFQFWLSWNQNKDLKFQFLIDRNLNVKKHIPVLVTRTGIANPVSGSGS
jgi:hypothetical protein